MKLLDSTRFILLLYVDTWCFLLLAFDKIPDTAHENNFWWFMAGLNSLIAASKITEKWKSGEK